MTGENSHAKRIDLRNQMIELLRESVRRRAEAVRGQIFVSLSGGVDSKSIAGFLSETVEDPKQLRSFTYHQGDQVADTDAAAAEMAAGYLGIEHEVVPLYDGDLLGLIKGNVDRGQGMANFCEENFAWELLGERMGAEPTNALFVGDIFWNRPKRRSGTTPEDILALVDVYPSSVIDWFLHTIDPASAAVIREDWDARLQDLAGAVPRSRDFRDAQDVMYLDQRLANTLMLWRECFQMGHVEVMNPYLDNDVLDFVRTLPVNLRDDKTLFKEAIGNAFPALYALPVAKGGANAPDWGQELLKAEGEIVEWVNSQPSSLDELISPDEVLSIMELGSRPATKSRDSMTAKMRRYAKSSPAFRRAVRGLKPLTQSATPQRIPWHQLSIRLLILRGFLASQNS